MIRLTLLGGIELVDPANPGASALVGRRKRFALLTYLAVATPGAFRSRDAALELFWPESDARRARNSLNQALHHLRRSLGDEVITVRSDGDVGASPSALWCDAAAFEQALRSGDREGALDLYGGDLLPGFFVDDAPGFERWLDKERQRFRRRARDAAWRLAELAEERRDRASAVWWALRSSELARDDEVSFQQILRLLGRVGNRAAALRAYRGFEAHLGKEYGIEPTAETLRLVEEIRTRGESLSGSGRVVSDTSLASKLVQRGVAAEHDSPPRLDDAGAAAQRTLEPGGDVLTPLAPCEAGGRCRVAGRTVVCLTAAAALVAALAAVGILVRYASIAGHAPEPSSRTRIIVDGFTDLASQSREGVLGPAIAAAVVGQLATVRSFDVVPTAVPGLPAGRWMRTVEPGSFVVTGNVLRSGARVRVSAELIDAAAGGTLAAAAFEHDSTSSMELVDAVARDVSSMVRAAIGRRVRARDRYLAGVDQRARRFVEEASAERERARGLEHGGRFAGAIRVLRRADSLLAGAETIAPAWREPTIERARVAWELAVLHLAPGSRDVPRADALLREGIATAQRAVTSDRHDAAALETLGLISYWYWLQIPLAPDSAHAVLARAMDALRGAVAIDPGRASAWNILGAARYTQVDYSGAYLAADRAYQADAYLDDAEEIAGRLFMTAYEMGDDTLARRWCDEIDHRFRGSWTGAYCRLGLLAWPGAVNDSAVTGQAWAIAAGSGAHTALVRQMEPRLSMLVAAVLARAGLRDSAEAIILRARSSAAGDPETLPLEASARIALGQPDSAIARLARYVREKPLHRAAVACSRRFAGLRALGHDGDVFRSCSQ